MLDRKPEFVNKIIQKLEPKLAKESYSSNAINSNLKSEENEELPDQQVTNIVRYHSSGKIIIDRAPSYIPSNK